MRREFCYFCEKPLPETETGWTPMVTTSSGAEALVCTRCMKLHALKPKTFINLERRTT